MLVSELADRSGVPVATVKYYLREGLVPAGDAVGPRRAEYGETHVRRLRILRLLRETAGVPVSSLRVIMDALDDESLPIHDVMTLTADVITAGPEPGAQSPDSLALVDEVVSAIGWDGLRPESIDRLRLAALVTALSGAGSLGADAERLRFYAGLADQMARTEVRQIDRTRDRGDLLEEMVTGSVVYGQIFAVLRQMGQEHHHRQTTVQASVS
jgi:DNA-binding transcriptional MerR regulator